MDKKYIEENLLGKNNKIIKNRIKKLNSELNLNLTTKDIYLIYYNTKEPRCPVCQGEVVFFNFKRGFQKTCSIKCSKNYYEFKRNKKPAEISKKVQEFKHAAPLCKCGSKLRKIRGKFEYRDSCGVRSCKYHRQMVQEKRKETTLGKYGVDHISKLSYIKIKKQIKMLNKNIQNNFFDNMTLKEVYRLIKIYNTRIEDKKIYYREVDRHTYLNKSKIYGYKLCGFDTNTQLDHKFSKFMGFILNIPPFIIGSEYNLEVIPSQENWAKSIACSVKKEQLLESFYGAN